MKKLNKGLKKKIGLVLIALAMVFFVISTDLVSLSMLKSPSALSISPGSFPAPAFYGDISINGEPAPVGTGLIVVPDGKSIEDGFVLTHTTEVGKVGGAGGFDWKLCAYEADVVSYFTIYWSPDDLSWYPLTVDSIDGVAVGKQDIPILSLDSEEYIHTFIVSGVADDSFLHVKHYDCPLSSGQQAIMESFSAGQEINEFSFRYPVNYFCDSLPVIVTDNVNQITLTNISAYADIVNGSVVAVPEGMTYTFTYFTPTPSDLPFVCEEGSLNLDTNECIVSGGLTYVCSTGQFDSATGACVVQPESSIVCETGRYDVNLGLCVWNPPLQAVCEMGLYNANTGNCDYTPLTANVCVENAIYNESTGKCELTPTTIVMCEKGIYDSVLNSCIFTPEAEALCEIGSFNEITNKCEYNPDVVGMCVLGEYNFELDRCEYFADESVVCDSGTYNPESNTCVVTPPMEIVCGEGNYNPITLRCEFTPVSFGVCEIGTFDENTNLCNYVPETNVACEKGIYNPATNSCLFTPPVEDICPVGSVLSDGKCLMELAVESVCPEGSILSEDGSVCLKELNLVVTCPAGTVLSEDGSSCNSIPVAFDESVVFSVLGGLSLLGGILLRGLV